MTASDKLSATHDRLVAAIEALVSGEDWRAMLEVAQRFHTYSMSNVLLICAQQPGATRVAGYGTWKRLGRQVRRGERGIAILAPVLARTTRAASAADGGAHDQAPEEGVGTGERVLCGFRVAHVFDVSQTEGEPLAEVAPVPLEGTAPAALFDALARLLERSGYHLLRADCSPANGKTHFLSRTVVVRPDLSDAQALKTLVHEIAHTMLHDGSEYGAGCRGGAEVEAESVAYLVCAAAGLRTDAYSFPYVARWADGNLDTIRESATRVVSCARKLVIGAEAELGIASLADDQAGGEESPSS